MTKIKLFNRRSNTQVRSDQETVAMFELTNQPE